MSIHFSQCGKYRQSLCGNSLIQFFLRQAHANQRKFSRQSGVHRREAGGALADGNRSDSLDV